MSSPPAHLVEPRQRRSRETLRRILDAFEAALETTTFETITVQEICTRAECSVGTFYGRVDSKESLLEHLRTRVYTEAETLLAAMFGPPTDSRSLAELLERQCRAMADLHRRRRGVIRAMVVEARRRPEFGAYTQRFNEAMLRRVSQSWLAYRDEIQHPSPERAVEHAAIMTAGYLRETLVFSELWPLRDRISAEISAEELHRMLAGYLLGGPPRSTASSQE